MLTRALIVLLLVLNLGVAAWWIARPKPPAPEFSPAVGGAALLQLVDEPAGGQAQGGAADAGASPGPATSTMATTCYRFGPFGAYEAGAEALAALEPDTGEARLRREWPGPPANWRVVLPTAGIESGIEAAGRVADAGFDDYYVMREGIDAGVVALGMYADRARAQVRATALREAGFQVRVEPFGGGEAEYWVDATVPAAFDARAAGERIGAAGVIEDGCAAPDGMGEGAAR